METLIRNRNNDSYFRSAFGKRLFIRYKPESDLILICGRSTENVLDAYEKLISGVEKHLECSDQLSLSFEFSLFNTSAAKMLFKLFRELLKQYKKGKKITIYWIAYKNDPDMMCVGEDLKKLYDLPIIITYKVNDETLSLVREDTIPVHWKEGFWDYYK